MNVSGDVIRSEFHQRFTYSFHARGAQKRKKDSQVVSLFTLLGSSSVKAERKYVGEIEPTNVITLKTQSHAVNACVKRSSQRSLNLHESLRKHLRNALY